MASFITIPEDRRELSLVTVFSREHDGWKLTNLQIGLFRIEGLSAIDWDIRASQADRAGAMVDAVIAQTMAEWTLRPGGDNIRYKETERIERQTFAIGTRAKGTLKFPIPTDPRKEGAPRIIGMNMDCDEASCLPMFIMQTRTSLDDTAGLNRDCLALTKNMDEWFEGVSNRNKIIAVQLVNEDRFDASDPEQYRVLRVPTIAEWRY